MSDGPVQDLIDQLKLMRVELGDVKKRQLTEERLKHLQAALEDNAKQIEGVRHAAAHGGKEGAERLSYDLSNKAAQIERKVDDAVRGLSEARRDASGTILARRRNVGLLALFSALTGLATGALLTLVVFDHYLERNFKDSIQLMGWDWSCTRTDGFISDQDNGRFCVFQISE
ncbi:MICOS complex subunit MIC26/MIC27 [Octadecabacter sp. G9-8]|uniref:MICOS complex subunit MIC26/MIC27 n=1 Tax=Octadecabacter dasysiphoniae TaxID=2909341 RepID=A0ABS9D137_9RHOB|nr:MICOS complex subunit MIC26/MIC27 [Octadecabacter dasysiphoniae]MCF2873032.1 MICOS complex subunit MIC26/MIC27 [Octadecabacter dasysiphoniae]